MKSKAYLFCIIAMVGWGTSFIGFKIAGAVLPQFSIVFLRSLICALAMIPMCRALPRPKIRKEDRKYFLLVGCIGYAGSQVAVQAGTTMINAGMSSIINVMTPVGIIFFAAILLKERINARQAVGIAVALAGAVIIIGTSGGENRPLGLFLTTAGMIAWALASVLLRKISGSCDPTWVTMLTTLIAVVVTFPLTIGEIIVTHYDFSRITLASILAVLWIGIVCTLISNLFWTKALEILPAPVCSMFYPIMPLVTSLLGILILGESVTVSFVIGCAIIIFGILFTLFGELRGTKEPAAEKLREMNAPAAEEAASAENREDSGQSGH